MKEFYEFEDYIRENIATINYDISSRLKPLELPIMRGNVELLQEVTSVSVGCCLAYLRASHPWLELYE